MKVVGNGKLIFTDPKDEIAHAPGSHPDWQESIVIYVWDVEQKVYTFFRIGHEPNQGANGSVAIWNNIWSPAEYYKYYGAEPMRAEDRLSNGFGGGRTSKYTYDGKHHWTVRDNDVSADLVMEDNHAPFDFFPTGHNLGEVAAHHIEATGKVTGTIVFKGKTFKLTNAVGHRDHSWGVRKWETMTTHRWAPAIFGKDFVAHGIAMIAPDRSLTQFGFVIRDGVFYVPKETTLACLMESDGLTNRGGVVNFKMESGEQLEVVYWNVTPGGLSFHRGYPCFDPMSVVTCGQRKGVGLMECANNTMNGTLRPKQKILISGFIDNGIFPYTHGTSRVK